MRMLTLDEARQMREWFLPDRPGPLVGLHVLNTGHGSVRVDRWPAPRVLIAETASNFALYGSPEALSSEEFELNGWVAVPPALEAVVRARAREVHDWPRVILSLGGPLPFSATPDGYTVRRLQRTDVTGIPAGMEWVASTWGGLDGLAASGYAVGAFHESALVSVACSFFVGDRFEDIGVATDVAHRRRGLSAACAALLCRDIVERGKTPSWSTTPDNAGSLGVAARLGFELDRHDRLLVVNRTPPA